MNDTFVDLTGIVGAFFVYPLFLVVPGFVAGWGTGVFGFRSRTTSVQLLMSLALSIAFCPSLTYLIGRIGGLPWVWAAYIGVWAAAALLVLFRQAPFQMQEVAARRREYHLALGLTTLWLVIALFSLTDLQVGKRLFESVTYIDYAKHAAVAGSILHTGVPPANPFFSFGWPQPLCYYYLWHLICALVGHVVGRSISIRLVVYAGTLWTDLALFAIIPLCIRLLPLTGQANPEGQAGLRRQVTFSVALLYVGGLDIIPVAIQSVNQYLNQQPISVHDIQWWNDQVSSWFTAMLWVPQHIAALVAALVGLLILRTTPVMAPFWQRLLLAALCGLAFASALGMSLFVTFVLAASLVVWLVYSLLCRRYAEALTLAMSGAITFLFSLPLLLDLKSANPYATLPLAFTVRRFFPLMAWLQGHGWGAEQYLSLGNLLALPLNYFLEFGFYAVAGFLYWRGRKRHKSPLSANEALYVCLFLVSTLICTFVRSTIRNNDLGWRGFMFAQFALLVWTGLFCASWQEWRGKQADSSPMEAPSFSLPVRQLLHGTLKLGVLTTVTGLLILRFQPVFWGSEYVPGVGDSSQLAYGARNAYTWVAVHLPPKAVVQQYPRHNPYFGLYADHPALVSNLDDPYVYGPPAEVVDAMTAYVSVPFTCDNSMTPAVVARLMERRNVSCLVVFASDDVWQDGGSWVWHCRPAYANSVARVYLTANLSIAGLSAHDAPPVHDTPRTVANHVSKKKGPAASSFAQGRPHLDQDQLRVQDQLKVTEKAMQCTITSS